MSRGFFKSLAEGQSLKSDIRDYYFVMLDKINESWWRNGMANREGVFQEPLIEVQITRNGEIANRALVRSSGNPAYDRSILKAIDAAAPLPPLPNSFTGEFFQAPVRLVAPLGLMQGASRLF
jgi:protein TonB